MPVSVRDIAKACGVSAQTVSHSLLGKGRVAPETRRRVQVTAARLGYRPNTIARTMRTGRFRQVGVLGRSHASSLHFSVIKGICREMEARDIAVVVAEAEQDSVAQRGAVPKLLRELSSDGLIVDYAHDVPDCIMRAVDSAGVPVVWTNTNGEQNTVNPDDRGVGRAAARLLLETGRRRVAFAASQGSEVHHSLRDRLAGYRDALRGTGATPRILDVPDQSLSNLMGFWIEQLRAEDPPDAIIAIGERQMSAMVAASTALSRLVPGHRDVAVAGICEIGGDRMGPSSARFVVPSIEMGRAAARMLLRRIENPGEPQPLEIVPFPPPRGGLLDRAS